MPSKPHVMASWCSTGSQALAVTGTSGKFATAMQPGVQYMFTCESDCWVTVAATGGAAQPDTAGNYFVKAETPLPLCNLEDSGTTNSFVHAIRQSVDCDATLVPVAVRLS